MNWRTFPAHLNKKNIMRIAIVGGGAAGFFAAITCAEANPACEVTLFERGKAVLEKVRISGGGRCNVTHHCFDARELIQHYPRGSRELLGPFSQFGPQHTIEWFEKRGVQLKTEADGRMFPVTDDSNTIVQCLTQAAAKAGVLVRTGARIDQIKPAADNSWRLQIAGEPRSLHFNRILLASGSSTAVWETLGQLGHQIIEPVPSLFTFNTKDTRFRDLSGISVPKVGLRIPGTKLSASGPLLITHWGLSGPAILRLSAWGARILAEKQYRFELEINWLGAHSAEALMADLQTVKLNDAKKMVLANTQFGLPIRLWQQLCQAVSIPDTLRWADADKKTILALAQQLGAGLFQINGKSTFKEEFVTAGGVSLKEINFKTFESRLHPGLFMAGEVLDIDAITGGFNFQAAWTGGWLAGKAMAASEPI
jgi:predicted Rossmann fold flavoprotein